MSRKNIGRQVVSELLKAWRSGADMYKDYQQETLTTILAKASF